jgi:hypothetical protein
MFIRWNRKPLAQSNPLEVMRYSLHAAIMESYREDGKPKQRFIKHLAAIQEDHLEDQSHIKRFWEQVKKQLKEYDRSTRERLTATITKKVKQL